MKALNQRVEASLRAMLADGRSITTGTVAEHAGVSASTAYTVLKGLVEAGKLEHVGSGRGAHFRAVQLPLVVITEKRQGLSESALWERVKRLSAVKALGDNVREIMSIGFTEMVNNAIDHSRGETVEVRLFRSNGVMGFEVKDDGVGIFQSVAAKFSLKSDFEAIAELQKGKVTTMPDRHSGQGIFFTSKMADRMVLESGTTRWIIDSLHEDQSVEIGPRVDGTVVRFDIDAASKRHAKAVYDRFSTVDEGFTRTRTTVKLFRGNEGQLVSRSEAKRLLVGLEKFQEVELDFRDVRGIAQGFADEVFRVWQREHPNTVLTPTNANPAVQFMIRSARAHQGVPTIGLPTASTLDDGRISRRATVTQAPSTTIIRASTGDVVEPDDEGGWNSSSW